MARYGTGLRRRRWTKKWPAQMKENMPPETRARVFESRTAFHAAPAEKSKIASCKITAITTGIAAPSTTTNP